MSHQIETAYWIGDTVFLKCRNDSLRGLVTAINVRNKGNTFAVSWGTGTESWHNDFELSATYIPEWLAESANKEANP